MVILPVIASASAAENSNPAGKKEPVDFLSVVHTVDRSYIIG